MNRLLDGYGVTGSDDQYVARGQVLRETGYSPLLTTLFAGASQRTART